MTKANKVPPCLEEASINIPSNNEFILSENKEISISPKSSDGKTYNIYANILFQFQPKPRLIVKATELEEFRFQVNNEVLEVCSDNLTFYCRVTTKKNHNGTTTDVILSSINDKAHYEQTDILSYVSFYLVNFPFCHGDNICGRNRSNFFWSGRLQLRYEEWEIVLDKMENYKNIKQELNPKDGFGITYAGRIKYQKQETYSSNELNSLISKLFEFLSFARGARTAPIYLQGYDINDKNIWEDWSLRTIDRWSLTQDNWFCKQNSSKQLQKLFPGWVELSKNELWEKEIPKINYWYCYAGRNTDGAGTDGSLIIAIAALELLSFNYLVRFKKERDKNKFKSKDLHNNIYRTLKELDIPIYLPENLDNIYSYSMSKNWQTGPKAIVETRNEIVHPDRNSEPGSLVCYDALQLALWYVEMMILRLCEYDSIYSNRLKRPKWSGEVELVPWKKTN